MFEDLSDDRELSSMIGIAKHRTVSIEKGESQLLESSEIIEQF